MHWKKTMINYLNILELWDVVNKGYTPIFTTDTKIETPESKQTKKDNDLAINAIINLVSESVALIFGSSSTAKEMWDALVNRYEGNTQIKRTKLTGLEAKFETFKVEDGESIEDMYNRLMHIQNEFIELGEPLSNNKIVGKLLRIMLMRDKWSGLVSALEAIQGTHDSLTPDDLYAHLRSFEEKLRQSGNPKQSSKFKTVAFPAQNQNSSSSSNARLSNDQFINKIDHDTSKNTLLLSKMFQDMLDLERNYNKEREEKNKRVMCFACHRKGHSTQTCFQLDGYKAKKKAKALQALFSDESEAEQSDTESKNEQGTNLALMASVDEGLLAVDVDSIIASKNITDETTIEFLKDLVKSRNINKEGDEIEASTSSANEVHLNFGLNDLDTEDELTDEEEGGEEYNDSIDETKHDLCTNRLETNDTSNFTNEILTRYDDEPRWQSLLDESNRILVENEGIIQKLIAKNDMLECEVRNLKTSHIGEIGILKVKVQNLQTEIRALRSPSEFSNVTSLDPYYVDNLINGQSYRKMDKIGLGFEKGKSSFESNHIQGPKGKGEHIQTSNTKNFKLKFNCDKYSTYQFFTKKGNTSLQKESNKGYTSQTSNAKPNHAFRYKYNHKNYKNKNFQNSDRNTFNPKGSNKTYFKGPDGWFYEFKNKNDLQNQTQRNGLTKDVPQHHNRIESNKTKNVSSRVANKSIGNHKRNLHEVKYQYQSTFKQGSIAQKPSITFCNYCCKIGHTSLECKFRNGDNNSNVVWVPKTTLA